MYSHGLGKMERKCDKGVRWGLCSPVSVTEYGCEWRGDDMKVEMTGAACILNLHFESALMRKIE